jgi:hypothetical protein
MSGTILDDPSTFPLPPIPPDSGPVWTGNSSAGLGSFDPNAAAYGAGGGFWDTVGQYGSKLGTALQGLNAAGIGGSGTGKGAGGGLSNQASNVPMPAIGGSLPTPQASFGQSRNPTSLDSLLQMLLARRNAYLQATNPQAAQPVGMALPRGLLGV